MVDPLVHEVHLRQAEIQYVLRNGAHNHTGVGRGIGPEEEIRALRHLMLAQVGDDKPLAAMLERALHARRQHRDGSPQGSLR